MSHSSNRFEPIAPRSRFYHGPYGRLFPELPLWRPANIPDAGIEDHFKEFTNKNMVEAPSKDPSEIAGDENLRKELNRQFDGMIPAGYTYFGQFVDHDLTLDTTPLGVAEADPERLHNFRTPRLDLDSVYGQGPDAQPSLYEHNEAGFTGKFLIWSTDQNGQRIADLPRNQEGRALIGDPRNDENAIVAQMHLAFLLAHNALVERTKGQARKQGSRLNGPEAFARARRTLCRLYQWIVWKDFLQRIAKQSVHQAALISEPATDGDSGKGICRTWRLGFPDIYDWSRQPFMPVEFSGAVYRFGHSMVRNSYQTNASDAAGFHVFIPLFDDAEDLRGFRPLDMRRVVQWDWFLQMESSSGEFPQPARKIDTKLSNALANLPEGSGIDNILAARNLVRGVRLGLPSGPDAACKLCVEPLKLDRDEPESLWYYILREAEVGEKGQNLGDVGSLIVCSVFAGILKGDPKSWLNVEPDWTPDQDPLLEPNDKRDTVNNQGDGWTLASIIRLSGLPVSREDVANYLGAAE